MAWHVIFEISGFFDFLFLEGSGGEEQDDGLTGYNNDRYYRQVTCP